MLNLVVIQDAVQQKIAKEYVFQKNVVLRNANHHAAKKKDVQKDVHAILAHVKVCNKENTNEKNAYTSTHVSLLQHIHHRSSC